MTAALQIVPKPELSQLSQLEAKANRHKANALSEWQAFVETVNEIYNHQPWNEAGENWENYCRRVFKLSSSRIRQYKAAVPYAELIAQTTGYQPTENQVRDLRATVKDTSKLIAVFHAAAELTDGNPAKRHFKAVLEVTEQVEQTGAVSVGGDATPVTPKTLTAAMKEAVEEVDKRFAEHRRNGRAESKKLVVTTNRAFLRTLATLAPDKSLPPVGVEITVYWRGES